MRIIQRCCTFYLVMSMFFFSCQSEKNDSLQSLPVVETPAHLVQKYVDDNTYIDLDVINLSEKMAANREMVDVDDVPKMKAALYRFYNHVKLVDGLYECDVTEAAEINVSTRVYETLLGNLKEINAETTKARKEGRPVQLPNISEHYLKSLLR